jgi:hypothetical protein
MKTITPRLKLTITKATNGQIIISVMSGNRPKPRRYTLDNSNEAKKFALALWNEHDDETDFDPSKVVKRAACKGGKDSEAV